MKLLGFRSRGSDFSFIRMTT